MATSGHMVVGVGGPDEPEPVPVPYVLSFTDLCYSVDKRRGGLMGCLPSRGRNQIANANTKASLVQNEFGDAARCFARGIQVFDGTPVGGMSEAVKMKVLGAISAALGTNVTASTCLLTGADVLKQQAVTDLGKWSCLLVTAAFGFFFRALFYVVLLVGSKNKRR